MNNKYIYKLLIHVIDKHTLLSLQGLRKSTEKLKVNHEKEIKLKEEELSSLKIKSQQAGGKKVAEVKQEYQEKVDSECFNLN